MHEQNKSNEFESVKKENDSKNSSLFSTPRRKSSKQDSDLASLSQKLLSPVPNLLLFKQIVGDKRREFSLVRNQTPLSLHFRKNREKWLDKDKQQRENIYLICLQHALDTTAALIQNFKKIGIKKIYFLDKFYSTNNESLKKIKNLLTEKNTVRLTVPDKPWLFREKIKDAIDELYTKVLDDIKNDQQKPSKIILLDDGGRLIESIPKKLKQYPIYAVEQTTAGYRRLKENSPDFPWISIATSNIKKNEDPFIGELAIKKLKQKIFSQTSLQSEQIHCGLIGLGRIGGAVAQALVEEGLSVSFYDLENKQAPKGVTKCGTKKQLIQNCNFIIGCTGKNTLKDVQLSNLINEEKYFISTSSEAIEFEDPMRRANKADPNVLENYPTSPPPFADIQYTINNHKIIFCNAGYPITFDPKEKHAVSPEKIAITRGALFAAVYQWIIHEPTKQDQNPDIKNKETKLDKNVERYVEQEWKKTLETSLENQFDEVANDKNHLHNI